MTTAAATIAAGTAHDIVVTTNFVPTGRVGIFTGPLCIATVKNGGDMIRNIDRALTRNGFVRTGAFFPMQGMNTALTATATKVN